MIEPIRTAGVLFLKEDKILLVKHGAAAGHHTGSYDIPAGRLESEETPIDAAVRELNEETGLVTQKANLIELPRTYTAELQRKDGPKTFHCVLFFCTDATGELQPSDETTPEWIALDELKKLNLLINVESMIQDAIEFRKSA